MEARAVRVAVEGRAVEHWPKPTRGRAAEEEEEEEEAEVGVVRGTAEAVEGAAAVRGMRGRRAAAPEPEAGAPPLLMVEVAERRGEEGREAEKVETRKR